MLTFMRCRMRMHTARWWHEEVVVAPDSSCDAVFPATRRIDIADLIGTGLTALMPWPMKLIVDYVLTAQSLPENLTWLSSTFEIREASELLAWLALSTLCLFVASRGIDVLKAYIQNGVGNRMMYSLGEELFDHLQRLSLRFHNRQHSGDLVRRVTTDSGCVRELVIGVFVPALSSFASLLIMFTVMWHLSPLLSAIAMFAAVPMPVIIRILAPRMTERTYVQQEYEGRMMALAEQPCPGCRWFRPLVRKIVRSSVFAPCPYVP